MNNALRLLASIALGGALFAALSPTLADDAKEKQSNSGDKPAAQPADTTQTPAVQFPQRVEKKLWAKKDFRSKPAPQFVVEKWLNAQPEFKNKVVLIDFWATWCPPCRKLIPELQGFKDKFKDDLVVIGVSDEKAPIVQKFMAAQNITYPMAIDTKHRMKDILGVEGIPHVLIISSDGVVRWQGYPLDSTEPLTEKIVQQVIDADNAARKSTASNASPADASKKNQKKDFKKAPQKDQKESDSSSEKSEPPK